MRGAGGAGVCTIRNIDEVVCVISYFESSLIAHCDIMVVHIPQSCIDPKGILFDGKIPENRLGNRPWYGISRR